MVFACPHINRGDLLAAFHAEAHLLADKSTMDKSRLESLVRTTCLLLTLACLGLGCTPVRFSIDVEPAIDELDETVVLGDRSSSTRIALIDFTGPIVDVRQPGLLTPGENPVDRFAEALRRAAQDDHIAGVIIRINSPGGAVTATDVLYREVMHFRESTGKPVVMLLADLATSGAYYLACAGDHIVAYPTTVTGSIGVIIQTVNVADGLSRIGITARSYTSGPNKNMGTPLEPTEESHQELFQGLVMEFYENFRSVVITRRPALSPNHIDRVTDGRIISGREASEVGLVDSLGDLHDAFGIAKERAGADRARLVKYHRPYVHVASPYARAPAGVTGTEVNLVQVNLDLSQLTQPGFYYLWDPSVVW